MVQLHQQHSDHLHAIALNVDFDDQGEPTKELQSKVQSMLVKQGVNVEAVMSTDPFETVLEHFHIFSLPAALLYGPDGKLIKKFEGVFDYQTDVVPLIKVNH